MSLCELPDLMPQASLESLDDTEDHAWFILKHVN